MLVLASNRSSIGGRKARSRPAWNCFRRSGTRICRRLPKPARGAKKVYATTAVIATSHCKDVWRQIPYFLYIIFLFPFCGIRYLSTFIYLISAWLWSTLAYTADFDSFFCTVYRYERCFFQLWNARLRRSTSSFLGPIFWRFFCTPTTPIVLIEIQQTLCSSNFLCPLYYIR